MAVNSAAGPPPCAAPSTAPLSLLRYAVALAFFGTTPRYVDMKVGVGNAGAVEGIFPWLYRIDNARNNLIFGAQNTNRSTNNFSDDSRGVLRRTIGLSLPSRHR